VTATAPTIRKVPSVGLYVGLGGATRNACVALCTEKELLGVCEQERITRVRGAGFNSTGLPDEVLDALLERSGRQRKEVTAYAVAEPVPATNRPGIELVDLDRHFAHASSAFLPSPFESATVVVCDREAPQISIWDGDGSTITRVEWLWDGPGLAEVYSGCAEALGFTAGGHEQRMEAMARLEPTRHDDRAADLITFNTNRLLLAPDWQGRIERWVDAVDLHEKSSIAAALQSHIGDLLLKLLSEVNRRTPTRRRLCVGGSLFANSYFNSLVRRGGPFDEVFIPINPGNAGLSVGAALQVSGGMRRPVTPFLGPSFSAEEIKETLDNCKLTYEWMSETDRIATVVLALQEGRLVAWFEGAMEWGPRALGARSIVANPFAPYVLDNLNRFLKRRDMWRGYALSGLESAVHAHFDGPERSPFMECDYVPKDRARFRHALPGPDAAVRIQTVGSDAPSGFRALLSAFGQAVGIPILVNTSFNGIREPIVCSPNDAVRVFFGSGLDMLVLGDFVITK
jgi:carbamoyltransferase